MIVLHHQPFGSAATQEFIPSKIYSMAFPNLLFLYLLLLSVFSFLVVSSLPYRLGVQPKKILRQYFTSRVPAALPEGYQTYFYTQTLDHFNYRPQSYQTFQQRYVVNDKYWGGAEANAPIFAYLGAESSMDSEIGGIGFLRENAPRFKALIIHIEHRYYGKSVPRGSRQEAMNNKDIRGCFNSAQALEDYAEILLYLRKKLSAGSSPIIVFGGSYGGMLASWFRLKYPHVALGALASSAPILYFDDITPSDGYFSVVTKDFKEASETCYKTIKDSWSEIDKVASMPNGLQYLSQKFHTCGYLSDSMELKQYLLGIYAEAAQYDAPPYYPVTKICGGIDGAPSGTEILDRIQAGVVAAVGRRSCQEIDPYAAGASSETAQGWEWQVCSEMVIPMGSDTNDTMFFSEPFDLKEFMQTCDRNYGVLPRPHWITSYYGGHDIKLVLHRFSSNIIFSNGLRDPYSSGGVRENISDSVVAVFTENGSHCLDIVPSSQTDPDWLVMQRQKEVEIIQGWLTTYYADLAASKK